jgi:hypothetical protein
VTFNEDRRRTHKAHSPLNLAIIRHTALNIIKADPTAGSIRAERIGACIDPTSRTRLFAA